MSDPVARLNAALEGRYAIERELGEGGMATVYLADDLKHQRIRPTGEQRYTFTVHSAACHATSLSARCAPCRSSIR